MDVAVSVALVLVPTIAGSDFAWSRGYWFSVATLAVKSALTAGLSYLARHFKPPATS